MRTRRILPLPPRVCECRLINLTFYIYSSIPLFGHFFLLRVVSGHRFTGTGEMTARGFYLGVAEGMCSCDPSLLYRPPNPEMDRDGLIIESKELVFSFEL